MGSLGGAFNSLLFMHRRPATLTRTPTSGSPVVYNIFISPSNYFRNLETVANIVTKGREFVVSKSVLDHAGVPAIKRGDRVDDTELGSMAIKEVREMFDFGGKIIGFRIRCD